MKDLENLKPNVLATIKSGSFPHDTKVILEKIKDNIKNDNKKELGENTLNLWRNYETEYFVGLMESVDEKYRGMVKEISSSIKEEMGIVAELERMLVETCVASFIRYIDNSRRLNNELNGRDITQNRNQYIANLSKQIDRSHRQFMDAYITLKQFKNPPVGLKINATNAFLSNNQQVNIKEDEIIKPI